MLHDDAVARLVEAGLTEKEATVYVAMLALGPASVQDIAAKANVPRASAYATIDTLTHRGLMTQHEEDGRTIFTAEAPKKLVELVEREVQSIAQRREKLVFFVPELEALFHTQRNKPVVRFYEGDDGLRRFRDFLARQRTERASAFVRLDEQMHAFAAQDKERLSKIFHPQSAIRVLCVREKGSAHQAFPSKLRSPLHEIRYATHLPFEFNGELGIQDKTAYLISVAPRMHACVIESPSLASLLRALFELAWSQSETEAQ